MAFPSSEHKQIIIISMQILIIQNHKAIQAGALKEVLCCYVRPVLEQRRPYFVTDTLLPPFCLDPEFVSFSLYRILLATTEFQFQTEPSLKFHINITAESQ